MGYMDAQGRRVGDCGHYLRPIGPDVYRCDVCDRRSSTVTIPRAEYEALMEKAKAWYLVNVLRKSEGHAVTLMCDNPDFNGQPNCAIEVYGEHTDWQAKRFTGDTVIEALEKAVAATALTPVPPSNDK